jgi:hypothetical protein
MHHTRSAALFVMVIGLLGGALAHGAGPDRSSSAAHEKRAQMPQQAELPATANARSDSSSPSAAAAQPADESDKSATEPVAASTATSVVVSSKASTATSVAVASTASTTGDALEASVLSDSVLAEQRGGTETHNQNNVAGTVTDNVASQLTTGSNSISENSFSNSSGIPIVIQNSGNNVLIQNSTILNLQLSSPAK